MTNNLLERRKIELEMDNVFTLYNRALNEKNEVQMKRLLETYHDLTNKYDSLISRQLQKVIKNEGGVTK